MSFVVGIDVGTTFTGIAAARGVGSGGMVKLGRRQHVMPSVVWIGSDPGELSVGESAVRRMTSDPANVASLFKRDVGSDTPWRLGGRDVPVEELIGHLVEHALKVAESEHGGRAERVALTFPAAWGPLRQGVLVGGARRAGIDEPLLVTEPEAAAAFYASERPVPDDALVAVFDFGGGTLDIAVVHRVEGGFELLGNPTGDDDLGGSNIDELLFEHVLGELDESVRAELDVDLAAQTALFWACVDAKEVLSFDTDVEVACVTASGRRGITVTRQHLENLIAPLVDRSLAVLRAGLASAEVREDELYSVLLVGGTSRIPAIADRLSEVLPCAIAVDTDPKTSVSLGAARLAMAELAELDSSQALGDTVDLRIPGLGRGTFVGRGGYSVVYRARQESLDRDVAVKLIIGAGFDLTARRRFEQECQAIGRLSEHPNIVNVYQSGVPDDGPAFLVMSYVPNGSYQDELDAGSTLSWQRAAEVGTKLAGALEAAHQAGIFHCDVKPANVLLSAHGEPLLADFGLARAAERTATQSITGLAGTPHYSPPEVFDGVSPAPSRDVYGLAATVHSLITGGPPIESDTDSILALMREIAHVEPVDLRQFDVPDPVAEVVAKGLAKAADDRYTTAEEFGTALANGAERAAAFTIAADTEHPPPSKESKPLPPWLRWAVPVAVVAVVIAVLVLPLGGSGDGEAVETTLPAADIPVTEPDSSAPATPSVMTSPSTVPDVDVEEVEGAPFNTAAEVGSAISIASDGRFGGRSFEAIDGLGLDTATGRLIAAKEPATSEIAASDPARAEPVISRWTSIGIHQLRA